jgi:outer membrane protein assembly factor BamE (lipoprotein component of BamABCDE complex)
MRRIGEQGNSGVPPGVEMRSKSLRGVAIIVAASWFALGACAPTTQVHGYVPTPDEVSRITPGADTFATVEETLGLPSSSGLLRDQSWYYVQSVIENYTYNPPRVIDRTIVAVQFNDDGVVTAVNRYGIEDGRIVELTTRVTETGGRELGVIEQLFGNIANLTGEQFQDN